MPHSKMFPEALDSLELGATSIDLVQFIKNLWTDQASVLAFEHWPYGIGMTFLVVGYAHNSPAYDIYLVTPEGASIKHRWTDAKEREWGGRSLREIYCRRHLTAWLEQPILDT